MPGRSLAADVETGYEENRFSPVVLAEKLEFPLELDIAPDGRVFFIELKGSLKIFHPETKTTTVAARIDVFDKQENGLIGLTLDPDFDRNGWIYLVYSPPTEKFVGQFVSRFELRGNVLDRASEVVILKIPEHRDDCCHHAGSIEFGPDGCLFISTGDNTHPGGDSGGYAPIDERDGRHAFDAQDTSGNTDDLRGKILRIRPLSDGSYTVPDGNLFPPDGPIKGRPEIYVMGCRNPWRINVDQKTGYLYWGEVGPDAGGEGPRGPRGYDEINQARAAGNFGWPFFIADNKPYADHDYATGTTGPLYDAEHPENRSPTNTGSRLLPVPQPAWIYYPYADSPEFPMLGSGGRTACAGPVYHHDPTLDSPTQLPAALDNCLIFFDWQRTFIKLARLDDDSNIVSIEPFLTGIPIKRPVDMRIGPEGSLYVLDYGSTWGLNEDARLLRIDYHTGNRPPVAALISETDTVARQPFRARFDASGSRDPDQGDTLSYRWSANRGDLHPANGHGPKAEFLFDQPGAFEVTVTVQDPAGSQDTASVNLTIGNDRPSIRFIKPVDGAFFDWGEDIAYEIEVDDSEDGWSREDGDLMRARLLIHQTIQARPPEAEAGAGMAGSGLALIQQSDCLNCHSIDRRIVGPSFNEIAQRYTGADPAVVRASAERVIQGSSQVWGEVPMLPHAGFTLKQAESMVEWIFSLANPAAAATAPRQDFRGVFTADPPQGMDETSAGLAVFRASYTDLGTGWAPPLTATREIRLRSRRIEGEHLSGRHGTRTLTSPSAGGGQFIGDVSNGQFLRFDRINLGGIRAVTARVASPSTGGTVELRRDAPDGTLVAEIHFNATGDWQNWIEVEAPVHDRDPDPDPDPDGTLDLVAVFVNPKGGGPFMNLDWLRFDK